MKKKLLIALAAATALVPAAAIAQERGPRPDRPRAETGQQRQQLRAERRSERAAARAVERPAIRTFTPRPSAVAGQQPRFVQREERRDDRQDFRRERREDRQDLRQEQRQDWREFRQDRRADNRDLRQGDVTHREWRQERREDVRDFNRDRRADLRDFRQDRRDDRQDFRRDRRDDRQDWVRDNRNWADWRDNGRDRDRFDDRRSWSRDWRRDGRYDWQRYRAANRYVYRLPRYYAPRGYDYGYRRFGIGITLGPILFSQNYWIDDPWRYRLPAAYGPYRWVRYYNDALLVDIRTGYVVDVIYDIFW